MPSAPESITPPLPDEKVGLETRRLRDALARRLFDAPPEPVRLGRFVVLEAVGRGGMGIVYAAYDPTLDRKVALKVLHPAFAASRGTSLGRGSAEHLEREATAVAKLGHPNVVTVHEIGQVEGEGDDPLAYMAMEFVDGGDLQRFAADHSVGERGRTARIVELLVQACRGLSAAHEAGLVHRDIKPSNLLIGRDGRLRVADFGLVRTVAVEDAPARSATWETEADTPSRAPTAEVAGTPAYMAPEQLDGASDVRSDQWSLCATFWEVLFGARPWEAKTIHGLREAYADGRPPAVPSGADVPPWLRRVLLRGLAIDPAARFADLRHMLAAIERGRRPPRWRGGALGLALGGAMMGGVWWTAREPAVAEASACPDPRAELVGVWGEPEHFAVKQAVEASGGADTDEAWSRVSTDLDAWTDGWAARRRAACESPAGDAELQADRLACLDRAKGDLGLVVKTLAEGDAKVLRRFALLVGALPDPSDCEDRDALAAATGAGFASPEVQAVLEHLSTANVMSAAGHFDKERAAATVARDAADAASLPVLRGRASLRLALVDFREGELQASIAHARTGLADAEATGTAYLAMDAWTRMGWAAQNEKRWDDVAFYAERALAWSRRPGTTPRDVAHVHTMLGQARLEEGKPAEAARELEAARALMEETYGSDTLELGRVLVSLSTPYQLLGKPDDAIAVARRALEIFDARYGKSHPESAMMRVRLAQQELDARSFDTVLTLAEDAIAVFAAHEGYRVDHHAAALELASAAHAKLGQPVEAENRARQAVELTVRVHGADSAKTVPARFGLFKLLHDLGRHDEAGAELLAIEPHVDTLHPINRAVFEVAMAERDLGRGEHESADRWGTRALQTAESVLGEDAELMITFLGVAGRAAVEVGDRDRGRPLLARAVALADRLKAEDSQAEAARKALAGLDAKK